jgi:hypothetical protein
LAAVLERLGIPYVIGGSIASSARGEYRATAHVDILAAIAARHTEQLARELGPDWYAEPEQMRVAIAAHRAFNVIHMKLGVKVDVFPATEGFHEAQLERATRMTLRFLDDSTQYTVATAEDILLARLRWFKDGGETSERQWRDIAGIVAASPSLEMDYLNRWAASLGVTELLARALKENT